MPVVSKAQARFFRANRAKLEREGVNVSEWVDGVPTKNLPEHVPGKSKPKLWNRLKRTRK